MKTLRKFLFPFALLYDAVTSIRNFLYNKGILKSTRFDIPIIAVGNLSVGGTGKTPMVEYLIRLFSDNHQLATLSRGYKRKTDGFFLANEATKMEEIGDEPFQYHSKYKNIAVAVDADRVEGVHSILELKPKTELILLDDAFQHRKIQAGFYIVLTAYDDLFYKDFLLPAGNLRESKRGINRADIIVVTKCPEGLSNNEMLLIKQKINFDSESIFFTSIKYNQKITNTITSLNLEDVQDSFIAVAGIAKPQYFYEHLKCTSENCLSFPDHHNFSERDVQLILEKANGKIIITTEKDYMRLQNLLPQKQLFYLPIEIRFLNNHESFDNKANNAILN